MKLLLTALPSIEEENWVPKLQETDALLVGGGDCQYLCYCERWEHDHDSVWNDIQWSHPARRQR
jgi:peptidase E